MNQEDEDYILEVLSTWYSDQFHTIYVENQNIELSETKDGQVASKIELLEENFHFFILRMQQKYKKKGSSSDSTTMYAE